MDPAEYLLELQTFASYHPPNFQKYHIDMHLKRFPKALENLVKSGDEHFDGCLNLAKQKGLLHELLAIVDEHESGEDCNKRLRVLQTSGEWLLDQNMHDDAAVAFLAAGETMKAFEAYKYGLQQVMPSFPGIVHLWSVPMHLVDLLRILKSSMQHERVEDLRMLTNGVLFQRTAYSD